MDCYARCRFGTTEGQRDRVSGKGKWMIRSSGVRPRWVVRGEAIVEEKGSGCVSRAEVDVSEERKQINVR